MVRCKFCTLTEKNVEVDFYTCDSCESIMCTNCMYTSSRTGRDYCEYCRRNLQMEGKTL
jgi:hypothetical protein